MHLVIMMWSVVAAWRWCNWDNWMRYYPTMLYVTIFHLFYSYLSHLFDFHLWQVMGEWFPNHLLADVIYIFIVLPLTAFQFLSSYPQERLQRIWHYVKWILIYVGVEGVAYIFGRITYDNGWSLLWSAIFDAIMFPMIRFHFLKPAWAWPLSFVICVGFIWLFQMPIFQSRPL